MQSHNPVEKIKASFEDKLFIIIFLFAFLLRLSLISKGPYSVDCLNLALKSQNFLETFHWQGMLGAGYPLAILMGAGFHFLLKCIGVSDPIFAVNLMSVVISSLCIPVFYLLVKDLIDLPTAVLSSILLAVCPILLGVSVYGSSHPPSLLFLLLTLWGLVQYFKNPSLPQLILCGIFYGLVGAARMQDMVLCFFPVLYFIFYGHKILLNHPAKKNPLWRDIALFCVVLTLVSGLFHLPYIFGENKAAGYLNQFFYYKNISLHQGLYLLDAFTAIYKFLLVCFSPLGLIALAVGVVAMLFQKKQLCCFLLLWILIPCLLFLRLYTLVPRFLIIILPPVIIFQSYVFAHVLKFKGPLRHVVNAGYFILIGVMIFNIHELLYIRHSRAVIPDYVRWVEKTIEPNATVITADDSLFYKYYTGIKPVGRPMHAFHLNGHELFKFKSDLDRLLAQGTPLYISFSSLYAYNPEMTFSNFMLRFYRMEKVGEEIYEDWHEGEIFETLFYNPLMRIRPK